MRDYVNEVLSTTFGPIPSIAIVLNGPPGVGKDTIAREFIKMNPKYKHTEFKSALYEATATYYKLDPDVFRTIATDRDRKEMPWGGNIDLSPREMLIHVSENVIKPEYGDDYFGKEVAARAKRDGDHFIITDGGFAAEVDALGAHFDVVSIVRLHGGWTDFSKDSRDYIYGKHGVDLDLILEYGNIAHGVSAVDCHAACLELGVQNVQNANLP